MTLIGNMLKTESPEELLSSRLSVAAVGAKMFQNNKATKLFDKCLIFYELCPKFKTCNKLKHGPCWILLGVIFAMR